jgi:hypothetical protein
MRPVADRPPSRRPGIDIPALVIDVESRGLHGEGYALGWVYVVGGNICESDRLWCPPETARGDDEGLRWARENVVPQLEAASRPTHESPRQIRTEFWRFWMLHRPAAMIADWCWPVEANFLSACIADDPGRSWDGPRPLLDAGTLREYGLAEPVVDVHEPLADAIATWMSLRPKEDR